MIKIGDYSSKKRSYSKIKVITGQEDFYIRQLITKSTHRMLSIFKSAKVNSLQKKYDRLMKEAYDLSRSNPEESLRKQQEAQEIQKKIIATPL